MSGTKKKKNPTIGQEVPLFLEVRGSMECINNILELPYCINHVTSRDLKDGLVSGRPPLTLQSLLRSERINEDLACHF